MDNEQSIGQRIQRGVTVYGLWLISSALLFLILVIYIHPLIFISWFLTIGNVEAVDRYEAFTLWRASSQFGIYFFGIIWLGVVIYKEDYFRRVLSPSRSLRPIIRIVVIEAVILALLYGLQLLIF